VQLLLFPGFWRHLWPSPVPLVVLLFAYGLGRAGKFTAGALLTVGTSATDMLPIVMLNPTTRSSTPPEREHVSGALLFDKTGVWGRPGQSSRLTLLLPPWAYYADAIQWWCRFFCHHRGVVASWHTLSRRRGARPANELVASEARFRDFSGATLEGVVLPRMASSSTLTKCACARGGWQTQR